MWTSGSVPRRYASRWPPTSLFFLNRTVALIFVVPIVILGLHLVAANQVREREERTAWQKLAQATDEFNGVDLDGVLRSAVGRAGELFSCDEVEVEVVNLPTPDRLIRGDASMIRYDGSPADAPRAAPYPISIPLEGHQGGTGLGELRLRFRSQGQADRTRGLRAADLRRRAVYRDAQRDRVHREPAPVRRARVRRHPRPADRPGQPPPPLRRRRDDARRGRQGPERAAADRPQPLQGDQRHARPRRRRPGAPRGRPPRCAAAAAAPTTWWHGSAATSSRCCSPASRRRPWRYRGPGRCWPPSTRPIEVDGMRIVVEASAGARARPGPGRPRRAAAPRRRRDVPGQARGQVDRPLRPVPGHRRRRPAGARPPSCPGPSPSASSRSSSSRSSTSVPAR